MLASDFNTDVLMTPRPKQLRTGSVVATCNIISLQVYLGHQLELLTMA